MNKKKVLILLGLIIILISSVAAAAAPKEDIFRFMKDYTVRANEEVKGSVLVIGGDVIIGENSTVMGDVITLFGNLKVDGRVNRNIVTVLGNVDISSKASVIGDCTVILGKLIALDSVILGKQFVVALPASFEKGKFLPIITTTVIALMVIMYIIYCLVYFIFTKRTEKVTNAIPEDLGRRFLIGFLINIAFIPLVIILIITVIGIFIIPVVVIGYMLLNLFANVALALAVGKKLTGDNTKDGCENPYISLLSGILVVFILSIVPVIGWLFYLISYCIALGAVVDTRLGQAV